jgi:hypothetical protein
MLYVIAVYQVVISLPHCRSKHNFTPVILVFAMQMLVGNNELFDVRNMHYLISLGLDCETIEVTIILLHREGSSLELQIENDDGTTGVFPFMSMAVSNRYILSDVYGIALINVSCVKPFRHLGKIKYNVYTCIRVVTTVFHCVVYT